MEDQYTKTLEANRENVRYNSMLVRAFIPLIPKQEREYAYKWLAKLSKIEGTPFQMKNKADYLWYFVMNAAQSQGMMPPFQSAPPAGDLPPLSNVVPKEIYGDVIDSAGQKQWWVEEPLREGLVEDDLQEDDQSWNLVPSEFVKNQPIPMSNGAYVYACVFAPRKVT
ncbi:uncharacterized protein [Halyomorpha halys]|uniref:uncharacterized protein n=1 Tax=Halyomorpha halys TaxID=286706 RepID=UPI0006D4E052|nr:uncharacterized protein LOC106683358 [Halyomorpha halys]